MYTIHPDFRIFLELLGKKKAGIPFVYWQPSLDFLTILIGDGDCRDYYLGGIIIEGTDILLKKYPQEGEDTFAGIEIWGGIQVFLSKKYKEICGESYEEFVRSHNLHQHTISIAEILALLQEKFRPRERYEEYYPRITRALIEQKPALHIPLLII